MNKLKDDLKKVKVDKNFLSPYDPSGELSASVQKGTIRMAKLIEDIACKMKASIKNWRKHE